MVTFPTRHHEDLYRCTCRALQASLERLAETSSKPIRSSDERVTEYITSLQNVFDAAIQHVSTEWDMERRDPLVALPPELTAECFRLLDLRDCISVSRVSRAWRAAALNDRRLWDHYRIGHNQWFAARATDVLSTLLARSNPLPFRLDCRLAAFEIPPVIYDSVNANAHRMGELRLDNALSSVLKLDWPVLKRLTCISNDNAHGLKLFPADWGAKSAPRLEYLRVDGFLLPRNCQPFPALRTLYATLPPTGILDISFFHVFRNLVDLMLDCVTQASMPMLSPLPASMQSFVLSCATGHVINYSQFFRSLCVPCKIRVLRVDGASCFLDMIKHFLRVYDGLWSMELDKSVLTVNDAAGNRSWDIWCNGGISLMREPDCATHFGRLSTLDLPLALFLDLHRLTGDFWDRQLPSLRSLTLNVEAGDSAHHLISGGDISGIQMPALQTVSFWLLFDVVTTDWLTLEAPKLLPILFRRNREKPLAHIQILGEIPPHLLRQDVAALLQFAERVSLESPRHGDTHFVFEAEEELEVPPATVIDQN